MNFPLDRETATADLLSDIFLPVWCTPASSDGRRFRSIWAMTGPDLATMSSSLAPLAEAAFQRSG